MPFLVAVITDNLAQILGATSRVNVGRIDADGGIRTGAFSSLILAVFLFLLLPIFLVGNLTIRRSRGTGGLVGGLMLIGELVPRIPGSRGLGLGRGGVREIVTPRAMLIHVSDVRRGLETNFCLGINCFFYQLFPAIVFSAAFIYLCLN